MKANGHPAPRNAAEHDGRHLGKVSKHGEGIQALAQYWSQRSGFAPGAAFWLVTVCSWVEVWPEMRWLELFQRDLCWPPD